MNSKKVFYIMLGAVGLLGILLVTTVLLGDKVLKKQADKLTALKLDNAVLESQQTALVQAKKDIETYAELEAIAKKVVPQDKDQARATREIVNLAKESGIRISSVSFPASNLGTFVPKPAATEGDSSAAPAAPAAPPLTQVKAVDGIPGVYQLEISVISDPTSPTNYDDIITFLDKLEQNRRTAHVSQITIQPEAQNRSALSFNLLLTVYVKP